MLDSNYSAGLSTGAILPTPLLTRYFTGQHYPLLLTSSQRVTESRRNMILVQLQVLVTKLQDLIGGAGMKLKDRHDA